MPFKLPPDKKRTRVIVAAIFLFLIAVLTVPKLLGPSKEVRAYESKLEETAAAIEEIITLNEEVRERANYPDGSFYRGMVHSKKTEEHRKILKLVPRLQSKVNQTNGLLASLNEASVPILKAHPQLAEIHQKIQPEASAMISPDDPSGTLDAVRCREAIDEMLSALETIE